MRSRRVSGTVFVAPAMALAGALAGDAYFGGDLAPYLRPAAVGLFAAYAILAVLYLLGALAGRAAAKARAPRALLALAAAGLVAGGLFGRQVVQEVRLRAAMETLAPVGAALEAYAEARGRPAPDLEALVPVHLERLPEQAWAGGGWSYVALADTWTLEVALGPGVRLAWDADRTRCRPGDPDRERRGDWCLIRE